jgi:hypothetical protein
MDFFPFDGETAGVCDIIRQIQPHSQLDTTTDRIGLSEWIVAFHLLRSHQSSQAKNISDRRGSKHYDDLDTIVEAYQSDVNRIQACPNFVLSFPNSKPTRNSGRKEELTWPRCHSSSDPVSAYTIFICLRLPLEKSIHANPSSW